MKKTISKLLAIVLSVLFVFQASFTALANDEPDWQDANWTQEEFDEIYYQNPDNNITTFASGLIMVYGVSISVTGTTLKIAGRTLCDPDVQKCGFTVVTLKRRTSSSASWTTYKTYEDLYNDLPSYILTKTITVSKGYQYRIYCTHYARKSIFTREKIDNTSNIVTL